MTIPSILSSAVSGLQKSADRAHQSANNIVRLGPGSAPPPSLPSPTGPANLSGSTAVDAQLLGSAGAEAPDLARELVNLIEARAAYAANAQTIRTSEALSDITNDLLA